MQTVMTTYGFTSLDEMVQTLVGVYVDRHTTPYFIELPALIMEMKSLRYTLEALTRGNLQLAALYQMSEANLFGSIATLMTELAKANSTTKKPLPAPLIR